jgi:hypothetical protein
MPQLYYVAFFSVLLIGILRQMEVGGLRKAGVRVAATA